MFTVYNQLRDIRKYNFAKLYEGKNIGGFLAESELFNEMISFSLCPSFSVRDLIW